ncbi:FAD-linked oxidoreductase-like protein [Scenedesmus sp. NREL 46B-D3]|nr:FAD-linked oxidoreductase-like protein [Scenedesmus sp. NREL 46B-D3]
MRSTGELLRMYLVLKACSITPLVKHAETLVHTSRHVLGDAFTFGVMRHTFMKQFCAGENEQDLRPTINMLRANGISTIIDYAAEDDVEAAAKPDSKGAAADQQPSTTAATTDGSGNTAADADGAPLIDGTPVLGATQLPGAVAVSRTYSYEDEATCDKHVDIFLQAIATGARLPGQGFAAIKVTALGNPMLLERMSAALLEIRSLFREADLDGDGFVDRVEFDALYKQLFPAASQETINRAFASLDWEGNGKVDIISWSHRIHLADMPGMVQRIKSQGTCTRLSQELVAVALTREEVKLAKALLGRVAKLAAAAVGTNVKLMIDAEHSYFQPAIDHTTQVLSLTYNKESPIIFNTYQAYLKGSYERLAEDMERARREKYVFAAKLVRGAYVQLERKRADALGYESPIWDTIEDTHANYNKCLEAVLDEVAQQRAQVMVASHNQASVERTVAGMAERGLSPTGSGVYFGQLLGMADNLTFPLGQHGYEAFKYVPYGPIDLVMPYLIRRAHENSAMTKGAGMGKELGMLRAELWRRLTQLGAGSKGSKVHATA